MKNVIDSDGFDHLLQLVEVEFVVTSTFDQLSNLRVHSKIRCELVAFGVGISNDLMVNSSKFCGIETVRFWANTGLEFVEESDVFHGRIFVVLSIDDAFLN